MAVSAQSGAMRAVPGMGQRPASMAAYTPTYPSIPTLPAVPALDRDAQTPNYVGRQLVSQQLGQLGNQQNAAFTTAGANAGQALKGYGGYQFQKDDPTTAAREDLLLNFDPSRGPGEREKAAIREQQYAANASGMLESGFANQNIASAVQRVSLEAQAVVNQYAATINNIATDYANQGANLAMQYAGLYGQDAAWLVANPPPAPPVNPNSNPYNGSPYSAGIIEQSVAPIWDWAERVGVNQTPITPAAQSGIADRAASGGWGGAAAPGGGGQARWKVKPTGFRTVLRNGWYYRA
jgi:hypothetical protein